MVGRALHREVERDLEPELAGARHEAVEVVERAELGVHRLVPTLGPADRPRAARDRRAPPTSALLRPLRFVVPIGWIGGRYTTSKPRSAISGSTARTPSNPPNDRGKSSYHAPNAARAGSTTTVSGRAERRPCDAHLGRASPSAASTSGTLDAEQRCALGELGREIGLAGLDLAAQLVAPRRGGVDPRADGVLPPSGLVDHGTWRRTGRARRSTRQHRHARPAARADEAVAQLGAHLHVTVGDDRRRAPRPSRRRRASPGSARSRHCGAHVRDAHARGNLGVLRAFASGHDPEQRCPRIAAGSQSSGRSPCRFRTCERRVAPGRVAARRPAGRRRAAVRRLVGRRGADAGGRSSPSALPTRSDRRTRRRRRSPAAPTWLADAARAGRPPTRSRRSSRPIPAGRARGPRSRDRARSPTRCGSTVSGARCARTRPSGACASSATWRSRWRRGAPITAAAPSCSARRGRRGPARRLERRRPALGHAGLRLGDDRAPSATAGGSTASAGRSSSSTRSASTTSAGSSPPGVIPDRNRTARRGPGCAGPGRAVFDAVRGALGDFPVVAENLGLITPPVERLRHELGLPGTVVLQFAFSDDS